MEISNNELIQIKGGGKGGILTSIGIILGVIGTLIAGIVDGYLRPLGCNKWVKKNYF